MTPAYLLDRCEHIADISAWMLAAARNENWPEVDRLRDVAAGAIDEVRALTLCIVLTPEQRKTKLASMQRILNNDGKIQMLSQPWLKHVSRWLRTENNGRSQFEGMLE